MGTKNKPGAFDCYANAAPDEPMFVLLGRDKHAALLVRLWGILRAQDGEDDDKIEEAFSCAGAMDHWRLGLGKRDERPAIFEKLLITATEGMPDHPADYDDACACDECCSYQ
jgi:hypothetical protein